MKRQKGFTLVEVVIVMAVIAILIAVIIPAFQGMQAEGNVTKAQAELETLKTAVISYRRHKGTYPDNIHARLTGTTPKLVQEILEDPFATDVSTTPDTYGYITGNDATFGDYFIIYSKGPDLVAATSWDSANDRCKITIATSSDDVAESNAPVVKE